ncbi:MAG: tyrosine-type recombinase/integrase, partial [Ilumatobacter sp.]|uniref:tyrosine-type recombinase/integrase n=1 Tax=Ilumatobacter sp. TaxID=1967498 RepID=UPI003753012A|nr:tyrosine-type recombinase/integrase [Ilumatobacter sp.]
MARAELPLAIEEFLSWMVAEKGRSANTLAAYRRDLTAYCDWLDRRDRTVWSVSHSELVDFVGERRASDAATSSIARQLAAIRMLHRYLSIEGERPDDPAAELEGVRVPSGIPKPLTEDQVSSLLDAVIGTEPLHTRDRALLELLYATGARISEAVGLSIGDINLDDKLVLLYGKGAKERLVPFGGAAQTAIEEWFGRGGRERLIPAQWQKRGDAEAVFLNSRGGRLTRQAAWLIVKKYGDRAGISAQLSPHV